MKTHFLCFTILIINALTFSSQAQEIQYDLSNYKTPDYKRSSLELKTNFSHTSRNSKERGDTLDFYNSTQRHYSEGKLGVNYKHISSNRKKIFLNNIIFDSDINNESSKYEVSESTNWNRESYNFEFRNHIGLETSVQQYYSNNRNLFISYSGSGNYEFNTTTNEINTISTTSNNTMSSHEANIYLSLKHGHGRIEKIENLVEAIYIITEIQSIGLSKVNIDEDGLFHLADKITTLKEKRFFDSRIYQREVLSELAAYLINEGLVDKESIDLFNVIDDYHFRAGIDARESGQSLTYGISPYYRFLRKDMSNNEDESRLEGDKSLQILCHVNYENKKPINLKWQREWYANLTYSVENRYELENDMWAKNDQNPNSVNSTISYNISYFPNTRTNFNGYISNQLNWQNILFKSENALVGNLSFGINGYYYLSEKIRLNGRIYLQNYFSNPSKQLAINDEQVYVKYNRFTINPGINLSLTYYIF